MDQHICHHIPQQSMRRYSSVDVPSKNSQKTYLQGIIRNTAMELRQLVNQLIIQESCDLMERETILGEINAILTSNLVSIHRMSFSNSTAHSCSQDTCCTHSFPQFQHTKKYCSHLQPSPNSSFSCLPLQYAVSSSQPRSKKQKLLTTKEEHTKTNDIHQVSRTQLPSIKALLTSDTHVSSNSLNSSNRPLPSKNIPNKNRSMSFPYLKPPVSVSLSPISSSSSSSPNTCVPTSSIPPKEKAKRNQCHICNRICSRPSTLITHLSIHTGEKPFKCPWPSCYKCFNVKSNMLRHYKRHEHKEKSTNFSPMSTKASNIANAPI